MNDLAFHPESQQELRDAARYYERQQAGLGKAFHLRIETALEAITKNPNRFALWRRTAVRVALVRRFARREVEQVRRALDGRLDRVALAVEVDIHHSCAYAPGC